MRPLRLAAHYGRSVEIDHCPACRLIWFDSDESLALSREGLLQIFVAIREAAGAATRPMTDRLRCPRCVAVLQTTHNLTRYGKTIHLRCPAGHGHAVTHSRFLAEKGLLRPLTESDLATPRAELISVACVNCGAALDAIKDCRCPFCQSPVVVLDIPRALQALEDADTKRRNEAEIAERNQAQLSRDFMRTLDQYESKAASDIFDWL